MGANVVEVAKVQQVLYKECSGMDGEVTAAASTKVRRKKEIDNMVLGKQDLKAVWNEIIGSQCYTSSLGLAIHF